MKELMPRDEYGMFADKTDTVRVDSRFVAKVFHKQHKNVLQAISNLECPDDFHRLNFQPITYVDDQGRRQPAYAMTRDGFTLLVMGFTGRRAMQFKIAYINRFNEMEERLRNLVAARMECPRLTENIKALHDDPKSYHYSNEMDMINRIVLGMSAKAFRKLHGIPDGKSLRPYLSAKQISDIRTLQSMDAGLALAVPDFHERKRILTDYKKNVLDAVQQQIG